MIEDSVSQRGIEFDSLHFDSTMGFGKENPASSSIEDSEKEGDK